MMRRLLCRNPTSIAVQCAGAVVATFHSRTDADGALRAGHHHRHFLVASRRAHYSDARGEIRSEDVSFVECHASPSDSPPGSGSSSPPLSSPAVEAASSKTLPTTFEEVKRMDKFARARVVNFLRRYSQSRAAGAATGAAGASGLFETEEVTLQSSSVVIHERGEAVTHFHSRLFVPLQHPEWPQHLRERQGEGEAGLWAHGLADTHKTAELLAAMHAQHIIDDLGYQVYTLPSMQRKHAAAAAAEGRFAATPDTLDRVRSPQLHEFPLPLRRLHELDEGEGGAWQLVDVAGTPLYVNPPHALLSPAVIDIQAQGRLQAFLQHWGFTLTQLCVVEGVDDDCSGYEDEPRPDPVGRRSDCKRSRGFIVSIAIPKEIVYPFASSSSAAAGARDEEMVVAQGKARTRETAATLAAMHAELVLDALHISLFPHDPAKQKAHALEAWRCGRAAPLPDAPAKVPSHVSLPLPLKELVVPAHRRRVSLRSPDEELVHRHGVITSQATDFTNTTVCETTAIADLQAYLAVATPPSSRPDYPFFHENICGRFKSTVVLPTPDAYGIRGGVGIAASIADADVLAAMHALDVLVALGVPVKATACAQRDWEMRRSQLLGGALTARIEAADPSPPGRRIGPEGFTGHVSIGATAPAADTAAEASPPTSDAGKASMEQGKVKAPRVVKRARAAITAASAQQPRHLERRSVVPRECWSLEADSPDGFIMLAPKQEQEQGLEPGAPGGSALISPRVLDRGAKHRVSKFLASVGRRFEDVFVTRHTDDGEHRCTAVLPVPAHCGARVAVGVAATAGDAVHLSAMHAELMLDTLGVCLFTDPVQQRRHAEACWEQGRWAPLCADDLQPPDTASPPALRREYVGSLHWEKYKAKKGNTPVSVPRARKTIRARRAVAPEQPANVHAEGDEPATADLPRDGGGTTSTLPAHTPVLEEEMDPVSKPRVLYYLRRRGASSPTVQYSMSLARGTVQHSATWSLPLPEGLPSCVGGVEGAREHEQEGAAVVVSGTAITKRDAEILSWMHAERVLDALGVCIFDNLPKLQQWHAQRVAMLGRSAPSSPTQGVPVPAPPPGLQLMPRAPEQLVQPTYPSDVATEWDAYCDACASYIAAKHMHECNTVFEMGRVPRTGNAIYDATLDEAEAALQHPMSTGTASSSETTAAAASSPEHDAKELLQCYCNSAGTTYPTAWKSRMVGPLLFRVYLVVVPVPGHQHVAAQGVGVNKASAQRRAAAHALALLRVVDPDYDTHMASAEATLQHAGHEDGSADYTLDGFLLPSLMDSAESMNVDVSAVRGALAKPKARKGASTKKLPQESWNNGTRCFTDVGKMRAIALFAACSQLEPPTLKHLIRHQTGPNSVEVHRRTLIEFADEDSAVWTAEGSGGGHKTNDRAAYSKLFHLLSERNDAFKAVMELVKTHPLLDPSTIPSIALSDDERGRMKALIDEAAPLTEQQQQFQPSRTTTEGADGMDSGALTARDELASPNVLGTTLYALDEGQRAMESQQLLTRLQEKVINSLYLEKYARQREQLSIAAHKDIILDLISHNSVVIICGTTGCGKTTQVPQFILDDQTERGNGGDCSILITQPRRLSAVSVAQRVAAERLETIGESCGYAIRFDSFPGRNVTFCTTGILLRMLHTSPTLEGIRYLIIDEIHERDMNSDFLLVLLRDLVRNRTDLRVVLMSATLEVDVFHAYFAGAAPVVNVEGYAHPVQELFIEDLAPLAERYKFFSPLLKEVADTVVSTAAAYAEVDSYPHDDGAAPTASARAGPGTSKYGVAEATTEIDYPAVQFAVEQAVRMVDLSNSSVLVFLPGWEEIVRAREVLERNSLYHIIPLHSSIGTEEQMRCFMPAPEGKVKVILSTNIAESGVTIDDVGAVIDVGRAKEKAFLSNVGTTAVGDGRSGTVSQMLSVYASRSNCVQRRGRAGRTRPGVCIRLFSRRHFAMLHQFRTPEMLRVPLDAVCLQILSLRLGCPTAFLKNALEPPPENHVAEAMQRLEGLGAVTVEGALTPLGQRLSLLPAEPKVGKLILLGVALGCLDTALTAASMSQSDVFMASREHRDAVRLHKENLANKTDSDVLASVNGFNYWVTSHHRNSPAAVVFDLQSHLLNVPSLLLASRLKRQFFYILRSSGLVKADLPISTSSEVFVDDSVYSSDALDVGIVKSVIACSQLPNLAIAHSRKMLRTKLQNRVMASSDSVVFRGLHDTPPQSFVVYDELSLIAGGAWTQLTARNLSTAPLMGILLLAPASFCITYRHGMNLGVLDDWLFFHASLRDTEILRGFKAALAARLSHLFHDPTNVTNNEALAEMRVVLKSLVNAPLRIGGKSLMEEGTLLKPDTEGSKQQQSPGEQ